MPYVMSRINVPNFDEWLRTFETPDHGAASRPHRIYRSLDEPDQLVIALKVDSYEDAVALRAELPQTRPFSEVRFAGEPRIVEELEEIACAPTDGKLAVARLAVFDPPPELQPDDRRRRRSLIDLVRAQPGFRAGYHLRHDESDRMLSLTIWDSEAALEAADRAVAERPAHDRRGIRPSTVEVWRMEANFERERATLDRGCPSASAGETAERRQGQTP
jgi:heme-degrading monooxygenase HmoA